VKKDKRRNKARSACERNEQQHLEPRETVSLKFASDSSNLEVALKLRKYFHCDIQHNSSAALANIIAVRWDEKLVQ